MLISAADLSAQYERAAHEWPFIETLEQVYKLPRMMLFAVGSRETNLTNETGDGGHGHGVWQLDDRSHTIPPGFGSNVRLQATTAAHMLAGLLAEFAGQPPETKIRAAMVGYNAGAGTAAYNLEHFIDLDTGTAHDNYSADTYARMTYLQGAFPVTTSTPFRLQAGLDYTRDRRTGAIYQRTAVGAWYHLSPEQWAAVLKIDPQAHLRETEISGVPLDSAAPDLPEGLSSEDLKLLQAIAHVLLTADAESYDGRSRGTVEHLLAGTFSYVVAIANHLGVKP